MSDRVKVCEVSDLPPGEGMAVEVEGAQLAVFNLDGEFHVIGGECTHMGGPLGDGELEDDQVECPWHGALFDVTTGEVKGFPATEDVPHYACVVEGDELFVELG